MSLKVLLIVFGLLGQTCENLNNVSYSASSAVTPHNVSASDTTIMDKAQTINSVLRQWPAANRTEIKIIRRGPYVFARQYWYPSLEIALKKPQPTSPAFTMAVTPTLSNTAQAFTSILPASSVAQTTISGLPTSNTTKTTISTSNIIQTNTTIKKTTSRQISPEPTTSTVPPIIIIPLSTNVQQQTTESGQLTITTNSTLSPDTSSQQTAITSKLTVPALPTIAAGTTAKITFTPALPDTSFAQISPVAPGTTKLATTTIPETGTTVEGTVRPMSPVSTATGTTKVTTTALPKTDTTKTVKTTMQEVTKETGIKTGSTATEEITRTFNSEMNTTHETPNKITTSVSEMVPPPATKSTGVAASNGILTTAEATSAATIRSTGVTSASPATASGTNSSALIVHTTLEEFTTEESTIASITANESGTSTAVTVINETETTANKTTPAEHKSATQVSIKPVTVAHTLDGQTSSIKITQEDTTQNALTTHSPIDESNTDATNAPTTNATKTTPAEHKTATQVSSKSVTVSQTLERPTTIITVTQEPATQADNDSVSTANTTFNESNTEGSTKAPTIATELGTSTPASVINEPKTSATKTTPVGGSSVLNSSTEGTRTTTTGLAKVSSLPKTSTPAPELSHATMKPSPGKTESATQVSVKPVTEAHASERPPTVIKVTHEPATQADNETVPTAHITFNGSNTKESTNATTIASAPGTNTSANVINKTETNATKATPVEGPSVINSSKEGTRTTTTGLAKVSTLPKNSTSVPKLPHVTMKTSPAKTKSAIQVVHTTSKPPAATTIGAMKTDPPIHNEGGIDLKFSLNETFDITYKNRTTPNFLSLAYKVVITINKLYSEKFKGFLRSRVNSFSKGSIIVDMTLVFENTSVVPNITAVEEVLYKAVTIDGISLKIIPETIKAEPIAIPTTPALTTPNHAKVETVPHTTMNLTASTGHTNTTSAASARMLHYSIVAIIAIIIVFVTQAQQI